MHPWFRCLLCTLVGLALALSGMSAAAGRLTMAVEAISATEVVICGDSGARLVRLDGQGRPMAPAPRDCATCPDCVPGTVFAGPDLPAIDTNALASVVTLPLFAQLSLPARAQGAVQARAPPEGV